MRQWVRLGVLIVVGGISVAITTVGRDFTSLGWRVFTAPLLWELIAVATIATLLITAGIHVWRVTRRLAWHAWYWRNTGWQGMRARARRPIRGGRVTVPPSWTTPPDHREKGGKSCE